MFCTQCGNQNPEGANNCVVCGAPLNGADPIQTKPNPNPSYASYEETQFLDQNPYVYDNQAGNYAIPEAPQQKPGKGLGIASLILGIVSLLLSCCCMPIPLPIAGLIMGIISKKKAKAVGMKNGVATAGVVLCAIALIAAVVFMVLGFLGGFAGGFLGAFNEPSTYYNPYTYYFI